ncbi:hypothetical protein N9X61_01400, partial [Sulfurimonas sp.]|nr:hypothetical protein [Sulfurimonas sp.]
SIVVAVSLLTGFVDLNLKELGFAGLDIRNMHIYNYTNNFGYLQILFPFTNEYRLETSGSLHNEVVEIFSFFGLIAIYYYYLVMKIFSEIDVEYRLTSYFLIFIIIIGSLIQINISNPYVGIMLGMVLAIISTDDRREVNSRNVTKS